MERSIRVEYNYYMSLALEQAKKALEKDEVPVGAVIVKDHLVISCGYNLRETANNATAHAELIAIDRACKATSSWRLLDCTMFVTLEPCPMCMGAIINARIPKVVFGAHDPKAGSCGSIVDLSEYPYNHKPKIVAGIMQNECSDLLKDFFKKLREKQ